VSGQSPVPDPLRFDPVSEADADVLLRMVRAFHAEEGHPLDAEAEAAVVRIAQGESMAPAWIARNAGRAVGYAVITLGYSIEYGRDGFIDELYLVPEVRGRGWGRRLLDFSCSQAVRLGIRTLHLEVEPDNDRATRIYRNAGFEETGRRLMRLRLGR
jgi:ribosomal protein S18 acetylase RimI-like enzyme